MNLKYCEDFFEFYKTNRKDVDLILDAVVNRVLTCGIEPSDLRQEVILRLARSDFLKRWNPAKSRLNTYFTNIATWYAKHALDVCVLYPVSAGMAGTGRMVQIDAYRSDFDDATDYDAGYELSYPSFEGDLISHDIIRRICSVLSDSERELLGLLYRGMNCCEIAALLNVSSHSVRSAIASIKKRFKKWGN